MSTTDRDVNLFVELAYRIREETHGLRKWDRQGIHQVFHEVLHGMNFAVALELVIGHASDPEAKTPGAIKRPFTPKPRPQTRGDVPPRDRDYCKTHRDNPPPPHCPACATEPFRADYDTDPAPIPTGLTGADIARAAAGIPLKNQETP